MTNTRLWTFVLASALLARGSDQAAGAALKASVPACADEATLRKGLQIPGDADGKKGAAYFKSKIDAGECSQLARGQQVTVDERRAGAWCVRPSGSLDCLWTLEKAVDLNPPIVSTGGGTGAGKRSRR